MHTSRRPSTGGRRDSFRRWQHEAAERGPVSSQFAVGQQSAISSQFAVQLVRGPQLYRAGARNELAKSARDAAKWTRPRAPVMVSVAVGRSADTPAQTAYVPRDSSAMPTAI